MASYLRTLAARALGDLPVVRPRQPSRFEPVVSADVGPLDPLERDEFVAMDGPAWDEPIRRRDAAPLPERPIIDTTPVSRDGARGTPDEVRTTRVPAAPPSPVVEPPRSSAIVAAGEEPAPAAPRNQVAANPDQIPSRQPPVVRRSDAEPPRSPPRPPLARRTEVPVFREIATTVMETAPAPRVASAPPTDAATIAAVSPRGDPPRRDGYAESGVRRIALATPDVEERAAAPENDGRAPSIVVSIGRVEVRASRPEPARTVVRTPRPQPRMTLDAFLSRQGRGR